MSNLTSVEARKGEVVSTVDRIGGIGLGYLHGSVVWVPSGSYFAVKAQDDVFGMTEYRRDGGKLYRARIGLR